MNVIRENETKMPVPVQCYTRGMAITGRSVYTHLVKEILGKLAVRPVENFPHLLSAEVLDSSAIDGTPTCGHKNTDGK